MMRALKKSDERLGRLNGLKVFALAACGVPIVAFVDFVTGYEVSMSLFYLGPVALAAWYVGRRAGIAIAVISCLSWYLMDFAAGHQYSHPVIPVWNALVRFGVLFITGVLVTALRRSLVFQQHLARTDGLTGLYSRRAFEDGLDHELVQAKRRGSALTLAYIDVDDFKAVNDMRGHAEGDRVLRAIGHALKRSVRLGDAAARIGGDEFALVLPDTDSREAQQVVARLKCALDEAFSAGIGGVTCSIGVLTVLDAATSPEAAIAAADKLMYEVKHDGKGAVAFSVLGEVVRPSVAEDSPQVTRR